MATSSISTLYGRCFVIFMACIILIEGCVYLGLAIFGLAQENCSELTYNVNQPFKFATDLLYFINQDCSTTLTIMDAPTSYTLPMNWAISQVITNRMYIFLITYAAISGIWIIFSLLTLFALCGTITSVSAILFFWPWFISVIAGSILDVVAAGFFITDITHTTTASAAFEYIGADYNSIPEASLESYNSYFVTPPIVMTCISLRLVIIWFLNVFGASFCISLIQTLIKTPKQAEVKTVAPAAATVAAVAVTQQQPQTPLQEQYPTQVPPNSLAIQSPPQTPAAYPPDSRSYPPQTPQSPYSPYPVAGTAAPQSPQSTPSTPQVMAVIGVEKAVVHTSTAPPLETTTYRNTETHPDRLDYPTSSNNSMYMGSDRASLQPQPMAPAVLSTDSVLNNRYSVDPVTLHNQQRVSDELRSQLPWSYTSMLTKPPPPKKPQMKMYPEIPEPDYGAEKKETPQDANYSRW